MATGVVLGIINLVLLFCMIELLDWNDVTSNVARTILMTPVRFVVHRRKTWRDRAHLRMWPQLRRYIALKGTSIVVKQGVYAVLVFFGLPYWLAYIVCSLCKGSTNYALLDKVVFRDNQA
jgi:putative flippase GtrA